MDIEKAKENIVEILTIFFFIAFSEKKDKGGIISSFYRAVHKKLDNPEINDVEMYYTGGAKVACTYKFSFSVKENIAVLTFENTEEELPEGKNLPYGLYGIVKSGKEEEEFKEKFKDVEVTYSEDGIFHKTKISWFLDFKIQVDR